MNEERKMKKSTKYLLIGTLVLFLSTLGASMAYYLARVQGTLSGRAAGTNLDIEVTKLSNSATGDLIPLDNDLETLNLAAAGYDDNGACVDINGYSVCQIYKVRVINNGSVPLTVNGTVTLSGQNVPHINCAKMDDEDTITNNSNCTGINTLASEEVLPANDHLDYYVIVYIENLDEPQTDSGAFNGTVTFESTQGDKVKGRFTDPFNLVEHIEQLWTLNGGTTDNPTAKTEVVNNNITYNYATNVGLMRDRKGGTGFADANFGNYRYYGENPNNYIDIGDKTEVATEVGNWESLGNAPFTTSSECKENFNCKERWQDLNMESETECNTMIEQMLPNIGFSSVDDLCGTTTVPAGTPILWRIIDTDGSRIRIIRNESIGNYSYDTSSSNVNSGYGINEWSQADLMKLLNPGYEANTDQKCVWDSDSEQYDCENEPGLINNSLYWNSGSGSCYNDAGNTYKSCDFTNAGLSDEAKGYVINQTINLGGFDTISVFADSAYRIEGGTNVIQNPSDGVTRTTRWTGKVGLPYPSDFAYAADFRDSNCQGTINSFSSCTANWMAHENYFTISPLISGTSGYNILSANNRGVNIAFTYGDKGVYPTLLLEYGVEIESGNGSKETPYVVAY